MDITSKMGNLINILAILGIIFGIYWVGYNIFSIWRLDDFSIFMITFHLSISLPGFLSIYYGLKSLQKISESSIKGLIASYSLFFIYKTGGFLTVKLQPVLNADLTRALAYLYAIFIGVGLYVFIYRYLLKNYNFPVPPINKSLPKGIIALIAFYIWLTFTAFIDGFAKGNMPQQAILDGFNFVAPFIIAVCFYQIGIRLFAQREQKDKKQNGMKRFLIGILIVLGIILLLFVIAVVFLNSLYSKSKNDSLKMPAIFNNPTIIAGNGFLSKSLLFEDKRLGDVSNIIVGLPGTSGKEIGIAGSKGALFLSPQLKVQSAVVFQNRVSHVDIIIEKDGRLEFMNRGMWGNEAAIYNQDGSLKWKYGSSFPGINDMAAGIFHNPNNLEFVVGFNGGGGVHLINENGKRLWIESDGNVWHVEAVDIDGDGVAEIIHSNAAGEITVRNAEGKIIKRSKPQAYFSKFSFLRPASRYILAAGDGRIWLYDFDGKVVKDFSAPYVETFGFPYGTTVQFDKNGPEYYAFGVSYDIWDKCNFYLYSESGELQFHEILGERCDAIATMPTSPDKEILLLGGNSKIFKYSK